MSNRWTPVHNGDTYCSPACGCGCTKDAYDAATSSALKLAMELGEGWQPKVWENCGWHYQAERDLAVNDMTVEVSPRRDGGYRCYFNGVNQFIGTGNTPERAFMEAVVEAQSFVDTLQFQIKEAQK